jgi:hypothetical protein
MVTIKNAVIWDVKPCGSCKIRRFVRTYASIITLTKIFELKTTLAVTSNDACCEEILNNKYYNISLQSASVASYG